MNLYDTKLAHCSKCGKSIGEIEYDCEINSLLCGQCSRAISVKLAMCV